ncbi:Med5-domain-containing protein [Piedraia hortae CBS 480.64]|uniref:Mediator of RNA polymerase II transcription subunit 5 n=1 Tax=Piedraia hortae CBS 480.64 TaxID=1314780 RepID=A0A6A7C8P6_9PEZI|nr:Med5-domain-containing protein [Piedraia hortae CBS 480.64]
MDQDQLPKTDLETWQIIITNARMRSLRPEQFAGAIKELKHKHRIPRAARAKALVGLQTHASGGEGSILATYAEYFLLQRVFNVQDLLMAMLANSRWVGTREHASFEAQDPTQYCQSFEERMFRMITRIVSQGKLVLLPQDLYGVAQALYKWLLCMVDQESQRQEPHEYPYLHKGVCESLGEMAFTVLGHKSFRAVSRQSWWKRYQSLMVEQMINYELHVLPAAQTPNLMSLTRRVPFVQMDENNRPVCTKENLAEVIDDLPLCNAPAASYVMLSACFYGRWPFDDAKLLGYFNARLVQGQTYFGEELLTRSFDLLNGALLHKDPPHRVFAVRSFICNKLPLLLQAIERHLMLQSSFQVTIMQLSILDSEAPSEMLKQTRLDFQQACALHGLIDDSVLPNKSHRLVKGMLVAQVTEDIGKLESVVKELSSMQGNAGAAAQCIVQLIEDFAGRQDTASLAAVCNALVRRMPEVDIILQHDQPTQLLQPLIRALNNWTLDPDQLEFIQSYEEYASILLFTFAVIHRYELTQSVVQEGEFIFTILHQNSPTTLNPVQQAHLAKWSTGLFSADESGETSGIGDDVLSQHSPQELYKLVPSLLDQSITACRMSQLPMQTLKSGLELLAEPFLLPSLVIILNCITRRLKQHRDFNIIVPLLDKIFTQTGEPHAAVLRICADLLTNALWELGIKTPVVGRFMERLRPYTNQTARGNTSEQSISITQNWRAEMGETFRALISWESNTPPPHYSPRQLFLTVRSLGANAVLKVLIEEASSSQGIDLMANILCAPGGEALRAELQTQMEDLRGLLDMRSSHAAAVVRMHRRVEAMLATPPMELRFEEIILPTEDAGVEIVGLDVGDGLPVDDVLAGGDILPEGDILLPEAEQQQDGTMAQQQTLQQTQDQQVDSNIEDDIFGDDMFDSLEKYDGFSN